MCLQIIQQQKLKEEEHDIWKDSPYRDLVKLQSNNVGIVGESLIDGICKAAGIPADCDGSKTKKIGGGEGDGTILGMSVEIKTAHKGSSSGSFQHELGEVPWHAKYMIFVDIAPDCIYITVFKNFAESVYKSKEKLPWCFLTKTVTWRKGTGAFKLDTSVAINDTSVATGFAIKMDAETSVAAVGDFLRRMIV